MKIKSKIMKETKSIPFKVLIDILEDTSNELKRSFWMSIKIRVMYLKEEDKERVIQQLRTNFKILKVSKEYKEGPRKRIYIDLQ